MNRVEILIGKKNLEIIKNSKILVLGAGGVGSHICESLVRNGFKNIVIVDNDYLEETNINRHSYCFKNNIGQPKVYALKNYLENIYDNLNINALAVELNKNNLSNIIFNDFDFIADAIDKLVTKTYLLKTCYENKINIISSMGAGGKYNPLKIKVNDISIASGDALLKRVKKNLKKFSIEKGIPVVYSDERVRYKIINNKRVIGSCAHIPAIFGNIIGGYIFNSLIANPDF
jgi:tRNA A37 threonylcarbamoyladenosine dehydratase